MAERLRSRGRAAIPIEPDLVELIETREDDIRRLIARMAEQVSQLWAEEGGGYTQAPADAVHATVDGGVRLALTALAQGRGPSPDELAAVRDYGDIRARQGVRLEVLLRGLTVAVREALEAIRQLAEEGSLGVDLALGLAGAVWDWTDAVTVELVSAHRGAELTLVRQAHEQRVAFVGGLVSGSLSPNRLAEGAAAFRLDPDERYCIVCARPTPEHPIDELERMLIPSRWSPGLSSVIDDQLVAILPAAPSSVLPVAAGLGPPAPLSALSRSFASASRALNTAIAFGLAGLHDLERLSLRAAIAADRDVGELLTDRYVAPMLELGPFGAEVLRSLRAYLAHDQSVEATAAALYVHPNTLRHRLARFEETTGACLRSVDRLAEVWWALELDALSGA